MNQGRITPRSLHVVGDYLGWTNHLGM